MALIPAAAAAAGLCLAHHSHPAPPLLSSRIFLPLITLLRHGGGSNRPNLQRPLPTHYKRKRLLAVALPSYPEEPKFCKRYEEEEKVRGVAGSLEGKPYHQFLVRELRKAVESHPMIAVFHTNSFKRSEFIKIRLALFDLGFQMRIQYSINTLLARHALNCTPYSPMLRLITKNTALGFCQEPDLQKLQKAMKKMPQFLLLGLVLENRLLSKDDVDRLARMEISSQRAQLCSTLNLAGGNLARVLESPQLSLLNSLDMYSSSVQKQE